MTKIFAWIVKYRGVLGVVAAVLLIVAGLETMRRAAFNAGVSVGVAQTELKYKKLTDQANRRIEARKKSYSQIIERLVRDLEAERARQQAKTEVVVREIIREQQRQPAPAECVITERTLELRNELRNELENVK